MTHHLEHSLHIKGSPLVVFNVWDAGSAIETSKVRLQAMGTRRWSVAAAHGYEDGHELSFDVCLGNLDRIMRGVNFPVTVDAEAGYGQTPTDVQETVAKIIMAGAVGTNLEHQIVGTDIQSSCDDECKRIEAAKTSAQVPILINGRRDIVLKITPGNHNDGHLEEALLRASAYAQSGAAGLFAPGLIEEKFIRKLCDLSMIPITIIRTQSGPTPTRVAECGVSRMRYGPISYALAAASFKIGAQNAL